MNKPYTSTSGELDYSKLQNWELFERFCKDLLKEEYPNLDNIESYLDKGYKQHGIDIRGFSPITRKYVKV